MTVGEMRKRVRGVLDFVGRWPVGEVAGEEEGEGEGEGEEEKKVGRGQEGEGDETTPRVKSRAEEVEELVRDLISFEQRFGIAITSSSGSGSGLRSADLGGNLHAGPVAAAAAVEEAVEAVMEAAAVERDQEEVPEVVEGEGDVVMEEEAVVIGEGEEGAVEVASASTVVLAA